MIEILDDLQVSLGSNKKRITKSERENFKLYEMIAFGGVKLGDDVSVGFLNLIGHFPIIELDDQIAFLVE